MQSLRVLFSLFLLVLVVPSLQAASFVMQPDEWMIRTAPSIVTGTVLETFPRRGESGGIETVVRILVDESLKGPARAGDVMTIVQTGGVLEGSIEVMSGTPEYEAGRRYLVFATGRGAGEWTTFDLALGQFEFSRKNNLELLVRDESDVHGIWPSGEPYQETERLTRPFLAYVRSVLADQPSTVPYTRDGATPRKLTADAPNLVVVPQALDHDLRAATELAVAKWNGAESVMDDSVSPTPATGNTRSTADTESRVIPDDPNTDISGTFPNTTSVVATAFFGCVSCQTHTANSETYMTINRADIVVNDGVSSSTISLSDFRTAMVHEVGHTWGFRHPDQQPNSTSACSAPLPCNSSPAAVMTSSIPNGINGVLQGWDLDAANEVYGDATAEASFTGTQYVNKLGGTAARRPADMSWRIVSTTCTGPTINTQPANKTIGSGQTTSLSVSATASSGSLTYQWYLGTSGNTSSPIGGATSSTLSNLSPAAPSQAYWVRVKDGCAETPNGKDSNTATITVNCNPQITSQSTTKTITSGQTTTLTVTSAQATGFQWYDVTSSGVNTDESTPIGGATSSSYTTPVLTASKKYWVKATTNCGSSKSSVITVTVNAACNVPAITTQPASKSINAGQSTTLTVVATGTAPLTYQWYRGTAPSTTNPVGTNSATLDTGVLNATTSFWVKITNGCPSGTKNSNTATVTVVSCTLPAISVQPLDATITSGGSTTLSVTATGATSITWYRGTVGDKSTPVGVGTTINTGILTATSLYWAALTNSCGETQTRLVTITVQTACVGPTITVEPLSVTIARNSSAVLSVVATGSEPMSYQWYEGFVLDTTFPVGAGSTLTTPNLTRTTRYWARVTNACGADDSAQAVVSIPSQRRRAVRK